MVRARVMVRVRIRVRVRVRIRIWVKPRVMVFQYVSSSCMFYVRMLHNGGRYWFYRT